MVEAESAIEKGESFAIAKSFPRLVMIKWRLESLV